MMEESMLLFDLEGVLEELRPLERNYYEFLDLSNSFYGWLITLNDEEFQDVYDNVNYKYTIEDELEPYLFVQIEMHKEGKNMILISELNDKLNQKKVDVATIKLVRQGFVSYTTAEKDDDWEFKPTEKGMEYYKNNNNGGE